MNNKFAAEVKDYGLINLLLYKVNQVLNRGTGGKVKIIQYFLYAQPVRVQQRVKHPEKRSIKIRYCDEVDSLHNNPRPMTVIHDRFRQGAQCFVAQKDDVFIGFQWFTTKDYVEDEVRCLFRPHPKNQAAWDFDIYIEPEHRLGLAFPMLWDAVDAHLASEGVGWTMSRISPLNLASIRSHQRMGAVHRGQVVFVVLGQLQILFQGRFPFVDISIWRRPVITVSAPEIESGER